MRVRFFSDNPADKVPQAFVNGIQLDAVPRTGDMVDIDHVGPRVVRDVQWKLGHKLDSREVWIRLEER